MPTEQDDSIEMLGRLAALAVAGLALIMMFVLAL